MYEKFFKTIIDKIISIIFLPFFLILILSLCVYIIFIDGWPPIYITKRVGKNKKIFNMYKIRTMKKNAEKDLNHILKNKNLKITWDTYKKLKPDPRLIKGCSFIRKHSLDELPQIFNILKGDMSFIGPRPYLEDEVKENFPEKIFNAKPGLTGLWQVSGRNNLTFQERINLDLKYINNINFINDVKIFIKTIKELIFPQGAF